MLPTELVAELPVAAAWLTWPDLTLGFANEHYRRLIGGLAGRGEPAVMTATSNALARLLPDALATAVYAVLDLPARRLYYATAGHLPPAYVTPAGQVSYLRAAGTMLGVPGPATYVTGCRRLAPGSRLLFYTDGLIEDRRRDLGAGLSALSRAMRASRDCDAAQTCTAVQAALVPHAPRADDICLLAARLACLAPG
jgi:serine phosphatase RsbU (regulator of sigma subunit)